MAAAGGGGGGGGRGGRGARTTRRRCAPTACIARRSPAATRSSFMVADVATGKAQEFWHNQPNDRDVQQHQRDHVGRRPRRVHRAGAERRVGSVLLGEHRQSAARAGAAHDDRRLDQRQRRRSHVRDDRALARRQDAVLLHERQGHREAAHLGGADAGRHAARRSRPTTASRCRRRRSRRASSSRCCTSAPTQPASVGIVPTAGGATKVVFPTLRCKDFPQARARHAGDRDHARRPTV